MTLSTIICTPTLQHDKKMKRICAPLEDCFGLENFWYYTLNDRGELSYISNNPLTAEFFYDNELYKGHPYFKDPSLLKSGFFFADKTKEKDYIQTQGKLRDFTQIFMAMNVSEGKAEGYGFATANNSPELANSFINNLYLFRKFIHYFHSEADEPILHMQKCSVDISSTCGDSFYAPTQYFETLTGAENARDFLKKIDPLRYQVLQSLSPREKECLRWFLKGLSAVQIGKKVHLSNRTVEHYLDSVKNKLSCNSRQELYETLLSCSDFLNLTFF